MLHPICKVIEFDQMDRQLLRFLRYILLGILLHPSQTDVQTVFLRIANQSKLTVLKGGLQLFMHHFVLRNAEKNESEELQKLRERIQIADHALNLSQR